MVREYPTLYARAKRGQVKWWKILAAPVIGGAEIIIEHASAMDAQPVTTVDVVLSGKNIGKANETTPFEQACLEAESRWRKKRDSGYREAVPSEDQTHNTNTLGLVQPMLALPFEKYKADLPELVFVQPKLDGHRCLASRVDGRVRLWSRRGKWIETMDHIVHALEDLLPDGVILDGELYVHGTSLQQIGSLIKRRQSESSLIQYHVYDCVQADGFIARAQLLDSLIYQRQPRSVRMVETREVPPDEIWRWFREHRGAGYEGAMVRHGSTPYEAGYRSQSLLKVKEFHDGEWVVRDITRGKPRVVGGASFDVAILHCDGFSVTAPGTVADKDEVWRNRDAYIGRAVTVQYAYITKDGAPFHPVALRFRDEV